MAAFLIVSAHFAEAGEVFSVDSEWKYLKGTAPPAGTGTAWRQAGFDDSAWLTGRAPFYYENSSGYSGNTLLSDMFGGYSTIYLRQAFQVASPGDVTELQLNIQSDDGCIVWINGVEVERINTTAGEKAYNDVSNPSAGEPNVANTIIPDPSPLLVVGENVVAIHALNASLGSSSDFLISASLSSTIDDQAPIVVQTLPPPGGIVLSLTQIEITFDDSVVGVDSSDLLINGVAAVSMDAFSPRDYTFYFPEPPLGAVSVSWASTHGISDTAASPNPFGGGSWSYTLDPNAPESVIVISEFLAANSNVSVDEDGDSSDWIEVFNLGPLPVNLAGWSLTDDPSDLTKWQFPSVNLLANSYLLVWASGKDRTANPAALHASFRLTDLGEYLALVNPAGLVVSEFAPSYPPQQTDVSYGRDRADLQTLGFFVVPTPGAQNSIRGEGFAPDPVFSHEGGVYASNPLSVTISAPSGTVRYTTNGSDPTEASNVAGAAINLTVSGVIKARVFAPGLLPSPIISQTYELIGSGLNGFESKLPLMVVNTHGSGILANVAPGGNRTKGSVVLIDTFRGRASFDLPADFQGLCEIERRGQSSGGWPKGQYNLEINDTLGNDRNVSLAGLPPESDFVLNGPYSDKILLNNFLAYELFEQMGNYGLRRRFVELFLDTNGGDLDYPGDYVGVYVLLEKIKIDKNRVDIPQLGPFDNSEPELSGGYIFKKDKSSGGDVTFSTPSGQTLRYHEPKPREITSAQRAWLDRYVDQMESTLYASDWLSRTGTNHYSHYIDIDSFVDYHWMVEFAKQIDGYRISNYFSKDRGGKIKEEPIWDWNLSFGNANYLDGGNVDQWYYPMIGAGDHIWLRRLVSAPGDPDFNQAIADRWSTLRTNVLNGDRIQARIDELYELLKEAAVRDNQKWNNWGRYLWPNPDSSWDVDYVSPSTYAALIAQKKLWIRGRFDWVDSQFVKAPTLSRAGGAVPQGASISINAPAGTIYYTLDGSDPRAPGGAIAGGARTYSSPLSVTANIRLFARARSGVNWSGPTIATYVVDPMPLVISEIMYHPAAPPPGSPYDQDEFEFVEIQNTGPSIVSLNNVKFDNGIQFDFSGGTISSLAPGARAIVVKNEEAYLSRYGGGAPIAGIYVGNLANDGERLTLTGPVEEVIQSVRYDDRWYRITDGYGFSLVPVDLTSPMPTWDDAASWRPSGVMGGNPGEADPGQPVFPLVVINEALTHTDLPQVDTVELRNLSGEPADISGWFLTDNRGIPAKYRIPDNTIVGAGGYLTLDENDFNSTNGSNVPFQLGSTGDELFLFSADASGNLTGYRQGFDFGAALNGVSFGRHVISSGDDHFVRQSANSIGSANGQPAVGPLVINEVMYHPPDVFVNGAYWNNTEHEFVEIHNITASPVPLYDPERPTNRWRLRDAVSFTFPLLSVPAGGYVVVVGFDPVAEPAQLDSFKAYYGIGSSAVILGPFKGELNNQSESVELVMPDTPNPDSVPSVLVDKVRYSDLAPWPVDADGQGASLQRATAAAYGNDPANWLASGYSPGVVNGINTPPVVSLTSPPANSTVHFPNAVLFAATASDDDDILRVEFYADGALVGQDDTAPYSFSWADPEGGEHVVHAVARDTRGGVASSSSVTVTYVAPIREPITAIGAGAVWKYLDDGSDQGTAWRGVGFSDEAWASGPAQLGYGDGDEATVIAFGSDPNNKHPTSYFRHTFNLSGASSITELDMRLVRDDGAIVYLNGNEIFRSNMPAGAVGYDQFAAGTTPNTSENNFIPSAVDPALLREGANVLAVEVHQANATSSDMSFDFELTGVRSVIVGPEDGDEDGLPDAWEGAHGLDPSDPNDGDLDPDGDGMTSREEYVAGTHPNDPNSFLKIDEIFGLSTVTIRFTAAANKSYTVQYTDDLPAGAWLKLRDVPAREVPFVGVVKDASPTAKRYYRLVTPQQ